MNTISDLKQFGLKSTRGRSEILQILKHEDTPVDVMHIQSHLIKNNLSLNQATVYRILEMFLQKGLVKRFEFQEGKFRYELSGDDHHHLICEKCGKIVDVSDCGVAALEKEIEKKKHFLVKSHSLEFYGICKNCQK